MFVNFLIKRPVFISVCTIIIFLVGAISIQTLPIDKYPEVSPTQIVVNANYRGASAEVVEKTVTNILERQINGVQGMKYITSSSSNDGTSRITVTFDGTQDQDIAAVDVQNRVALAQSQLPESVQRHGVTVSKESNNMLLAMVLSSDRPDYDNVFLSNYADLYLTDVLKRINGVGEVRIFGERRYAMRLWLDPNRLASRHLTAQDVINVLQEQNMQVGAGQIGQPPISADQMYQIDLTAASKLTEVAEFENIVLKTGTDGSIITFKDIGRAELGAENYNSFLRSRGKEGIGMGIFPTTGSNTLQVARAVKTEMNRLAKSFPGGVKYQVAFDTTNFVEASFTELITTLLQAIALLVLVMLIFLQDWQTTLIPLVTIPVSLIGTLALIKVFGFSMNILTMCSLTLATVIVIDDALIIVENISRCIQDRGMSPRQAAVATIDELWGVIIGKSLVFIALFVPVALFPGSTGQIYRQLGLTIAVSLAISTLLAISFTPTLSALLIRKKPQLQGILGWCCSHINWLIKQTQQQYERSLRYLNRLRAIAIGVLFVCLALTSWLYITVPTTLIPDEDQGYFIIMIQAPEGVSLNYTNKVMAQVEAEILKVPEISDTFAIGGFSFSGNTANSGVILTTLKPWNHRQQSVQTIIHNLQTVLSHISEARVLLLNPPSLPGLSNFGGFQLQLQDKSANLSFNTMLEVTDKIIAAAHQIPGLQTVFSNFSANAPQMLITVDRNQAKLLQVPIDNIFNTLQTYLGSQYVNDFNFLSRNYRVYVQADAKFRSEPGDVGKLYVRSQTGQMIPLSNLVNLTPTIGAQTINHYNLSRSIAINGAAAPGYSSGQAIAAMERLVQKSLPTSMDYEWSGMTNAEQAFTHQVPVIFALGLVLAFLVLAAKYENYVEPLIIMLSVPLGILGALTAQSLRGGSNDIFCQVGLVVLIGLASKNAILIVESANQLRYRGLSITKAAIHAARERLRPILITALSMLIGIFPLVMAGGASAASRQSLGTAVCGGLLVTTCLSLLIVPILYIMMKNVSDRIHSHRQPPLINAHPENQIPTVIHRR